MIYRGDRDVEGTLRRETITDTSFSLKKSEIRIILLSVISEIKKSKISESCRDDMLILCISLILLSFSISLITLYNIILTCLLPKVLTCVSLFITFDESVLSIDVRFK